MTPFEKAQLAVSEGKLKAPNVSNENGPIDYFGYQLTVHHFNLKVMAKGMKFRGITLKELKAYYGLKSKSAIDCLAEFTVIVDAYKAKYQAKVAG